MIVVRSLLFNLVFFGGTAIAAVLLVPTLVLPRRALMAAGRMWSRWVNAMLRVIVGIRVELRGQEHLPTGAAIIAAKHQSAWDTIAFPIWLPDPAFALKRDLVLIPFYGWYLLKSRQMVIDRKGGAKALRGMVRAARTALAGDRQVIVFPQGTRVAPGSHRAYQPGIAALYVQLGRPVVPVALNSGLFWGRRSFLKRPGTIVVEFLPPIPPGLPRAEFARLLESRIETATAALLAEAAGSPEADRELVL